MAVSLENPVLNSPSHKLSQHCALNEKGMPTGYNREGRRASVDIIAIAQIRAGHPDQTTLGVTVKAATGTNDLVNTIRWRIDATAALPSGHWGGTCDTQRQLAQRVTPATSRCSSAIVDAVETVTLRPRWPLGLRSPKRWPKRSTVTARRPTREILGGDTGNEGIRI
jgi:hypothetical protein